MVSFAPLSELQSAGLLPRNATEEKVYHKNFLLVIFMNKRLFIFSGRNHPAALDPVKGLRKPGRGMYGSSGQQLPFVGNCTSDFCYLACPVGGVHIPYKRTSMKREMTSSSETPKCRLPCISRSITKYVW